jgi:hypothetical protein
LNPGFHARFIAGLFLDASVRISHGIHASSALKAQNTTAQGNALGFKTKMIKSPERAKQNFRTLFRPFQGFSYFTICPRALPWAVISRAFSPDFPILMPLCAETKVKPLLEPKINRRYRFSMKLVDLPEVQALTTREKLQFVDELWRDVAHEIDLLEVADEEKKLLDERWAKFLADPLARSRWISSTKELKKLRA